MDWTQVTVVAVTLVAGFMTWVLNERSKRRFEDYTRREARYVELVNSIRGFHVETGSRETKERFLTELELLWLYGSDEVIRAGYGFVDKVKTGRTTSDEDKALAVGILVLAIRKDLIRRAPLRRTGLAASEFEILEATGQRAGS